MIQELEDLKNSILEQRYEDALTLIYEFRWNESANKKLILLNLL